MAHLSLSRAWDETRQVLRRDGRLVSAVALALLVLPGVIGDVATPRHSGMQMAPWGYWTVLSLAALLIGLAGQLAIVRLALGPALSVGEAIRHGLRRLPVYLGATVLWMMPFVLAISLIFSSSPNPEKPSGAVALATLVLLGALIFVAVRLLVSVVVATAERGGSIEILRRSWSLTKGRFARLMVFLFVFLVAFVVLSLAVGAVVGTAVKLTLGEVEQFTVAALLVSLATQLVSAVITALLMIMLARLYAQLAGSGEQPG